MRARMLEGDEPNREVQRAEPLRRPTLATMLVALAIGVGFLVHLRAWSFLCDDAFISFRYAKNLGQHGALVYNFDGVRVEGYTNLLWVLILGLGQLIGLAPERLAPVLTAAASLASLGLVALISAELRRRFGPGQREPHAFALVDLLAPAWLVLTPEFVVWGSSGLETSLALALTLAAMFTWLRGRIELAAMFAALAGLTRLDALLGIAAFGLAWLAVVAFNVALKKDRKPIPWRRVAIAAVVFATPLLAQLLFRRFYYGEWWPNTWAVKHYGALLRDTYGVGYLKFWAACIELYWLAPFVVFVRPRHLIVVAPILAQLYWAWSIGGDFMAYGRFLLPATTLLALLIGLGLGEAREQLRARFSSPRSHGVEVAWALFALALLLPATLRVPERLALDRERAHLRLDEHSPGFESVAAMHRFAAIRRAAGEAFAKVLPPDTVVTVGAAGAMPYTSGFTAYDSYGLVAPLVVLVTLPRVDKARPGHQLHADLETMLVYQPDLMCHIGYAGEHKPSRSLVRRMGAPPLTSWACVTTGAIPDRRAEGGKIPSHYYCCVRTLDSFEELDPNRRPK